jgi:dolichol-phosphate mannosyltransferase
MARFVAGMYAIRDCTAGYRCIRASIIKKINIKNIHSNGYCFQIEILHKAIRNGARVKEIPVHFVDRKVGKSKLGLSDILEFLVAVWKIRLNDSATFIKFCIVGLTGVGVNLGLLALLLAFDINKYVASPVAIQSSIVTNFFFNNSWTFRKRGLISAAVKAVRFNLVALLALGFSYGVFVLLSIFTTLHPLLAQAVGIVPAVFINYFLNLYWTWGE